jgi:hypothetical protein
MNRMQDKITVMDKTSFEIVKFKYLGRELTNQNCTHEEMKSRLNSGNSCFHLDQNFFSSCLLASNEMTEIYQTIILTVILQGCETWFSK